MERWNGSRALSTEESITSQLGNPSAVAHRHRNPNPPKWFDPQLFNYLKLWSKSVRVHGNETSGRPRPTEGRSRNAEPGTEVGHDQGADDRGFRCLHRKRAHKVQLCTVGTGCRWTRPRRWSKAECNPPLDLINVAAEELIPPDHQSRTRDWSSAHLSLPIQTGPSSEWSD